MHDDATLIDRIYEAAAVPDFWPDVLGRMSRIAGSEGGVLFTANPERVRWTSSADIHDRMETFVRDGWAAMNPRIERMAAVASDGFVRDSDSLTLEEMDRDPVYSGFFKKVGLGFCVGTQIFAPSGDSLILSFERAFREGPAHDETVRLFDSLRPHLARSALLSARLGLERAQAQADVLQTLGIPGGVLRGGGALFAANALLEALMPSLLQDRRDRICLTDENADVLLADALARVSRMGLAACVNSIPVAAAEGRPPMILHLLPIRGAAHDFFAQATALLIVTPVDRAAVPTAEMLQALFDLTPAEARVARSIGEARSVDDIAILQGSSPATIRSQLKSVLAKTGMTRQQQLVSLLAGKALPSEG